MGKIYKSSLMLTSFSKSCYDAEKNEFELYKIGWKCFDSVPSIFLSSQPNGSFFGGRGNSVVQIFSVRSRMVDFAHCQF